MVAAMLASGQAAVAQNDAATIHVYGPGGPAPAMTECAKTFSTLSGANVVVTSGPTSQWIQAAKTNADLFYSGSENMMTDFTSLFSGQIDPVTIDPIYVRSAIIMAHPGNPKNIKDFEDLLRPGVTVMIVQGSGQTGLWEDIAGRTSDVAIIRALRSNIVAFEPDTATAHAVWNGPNPPDAWIALASEHGAHPDESEAIPLRLNLLIIRDAGIALTQVGESKQLAVKFYDFVRSPAGAAIFMRWGWCPVYCTAPDEDSSLNNQKEN
jgi:accessory colonization factor AcfC